MARAAISGGSALRASLLVLELRHALGLDGPARITLGRPGPIGPRQRRVDGREVVAVDDERPGAEGLDSGGVAVEVPFELGRPALAEPVHVDDGGEVAQAVVAGLVEGLPDRALGVSLSRTAPRRGTQPVEAAAG